MAAGWSGRHVSGHSLFDWLAVRLVLIVGYLNELRPIQHPLSKTNENELKRTSHTLPRTRRP